MKKIKDPDAKRLTKLRSALRGVWQYDPLRKVVITAVEYDRDMIAGKYFRCPLCKREWPTQLATVDHEPPIGSLTMDTIGDWIKRLFYGPQRAICKLCHKTVTASQRRKYVSA